MTRLRDKNMRFMMFCVLVLVSLAHGCAGKPSTIQIDRNPPYSLCGEDFQPCTWDNVIGSYLNP